MERFELCFDVELDLYVLVYYGTISQGNEVFMSSEYESIFEQFFLRKRLQLGEFLGVREALMQLITFQRLQAHAIGRLYFLIPITYRIQVDVSHARLVVEKYMLHYRHGNIKSFLDVRFFQFVRRYIYKTND